MTNRDEHAQALITMADRMVADGIAVTHIKIGTEWVAVDVIDFSTLFYAQNSRTGDVYAGPIESITAVKYEKTRQGRISMG